MEIVQLNKKGDVTKVLSVIPLAKQVGIEVEMLVEQIFHNMRAPWIKQDNANALRGNGGQANGEHHNQN